MFEPIIITRTFTKPRKGKNKSRVKQYKMFPKVYGMKSWKEFIETSILLSYTQGQCFFEMYANGLKVIQ